MKVDQRYLDQAGASGPSRLDKSQETQSTSSGRTHTASTHSGQASDQVELSDFSGRLLDVATTDRPERATRIAQLTAEVRSGSYRLDDAETARRMLDEATRNVA